MAEDEGFDLHFLPYGKEIKVWIPSSRTPAICHRHIAFDWFESPTTANKKAPTTKVVGAFLAEDEGFEPPQTESESGVLPLHKSSMVVETTGLEPVTSCV